MIKKIIGYLLALVGLSIIVGQIATWFQPGPGYALTSPHGIGYLFGRISAFLIGIALIYYGWKLQRISKA